MIQNIKVDLVYYKTNTDFEMEFNLCGCCRMRLLNDKSSDRKTFLHSLARAVSRSKIIMIVGPLFGEDGITELAAGALSSETCVADSKMYGIKGGEEIRILKGSTPLVTPDGYFGGCIIESGPQTMILISDNKNIRKSIMQSLIHPYIEEVATGGTAEKPAAPIEEEVATEAETEIIEETNEETLPDEEEEIIPEQENSEDNEELPEDEEEIVMESPEPKYNATNNLIQDDYETETEDDTEFITDITPPPVFDFNSFANDDEDDFVAEDDYKGFHKPADVMKSLNISILILAVVVALLVIILCYCIFYVPSKDGIDAATYIREIFDSLFV